MSFLNISVSRVLSPPFSAGLGHASTSVEARIGRLFGSALRDDFGPDSDVDLLYEFEDDARIGLVELEALESELASTFGHPVDLAPRRFVHRVIRDDVFADARKVYAA